MDMDLERISKFIHDYFLALDEPPATELLVPVEQLKFEGDKGFATLIYQYAGKPSHTVKIEFDPENLDKGNFDVNYRFVNGY